MPYTQLSTDERYILTHLHLCGYTPAQIGRTLQRHPGTIGRELKRNADRLCGYHYESAQRQAAQRRTQANQRYKLRSAAGGEQTKLERFVRDKLDEQVSPELIAGRLQRDHPNQSAMHISAEAIYQWIYRMAQRGVDLYQKLYQRRKRRRPRTVGKRTKKGVIVDRVGIEQRPVTVDERKRFGDWESDTIEGAKGTGVIVTHVERKSRLVRLARLDSKHAAPLSQATNRLLGKLPKCLRRTMTADNGTEFADFKTIEQGLGVKVYFANPHSPWERGLNENTNGILRRWLPKGSDFSKVTNKQLAKIQRMMNNRPRKCLNYRTPLEVVNALPGVALRN
jgi:IS30 family transposase